MCRAAALALVVITAPALSANLLLNPSFQDPAVAQIEFESAPVDGDSIEMDTNGVARVYEFDTDGNVGVGHVQIDISANPTEDNAAQLLSNAINTDFAGLIVPFNSETEDINTADSPKVIVVWDGTGGDGVQNSTTQASTVDIIIVGDVSDGDQVVIDPGGVDATYEFDTDSSVTPGAVAVDISGGVDKNTAVTQLAAAVNGDGSALATAATGIDPGNGQPITILTWIGLDGDDVPVLDLVDANGNIIPRNCEFTGQIVVDHFNEACRSNGLTILDWEGNNGVRNGNVFIPGPFALCPDEGGCRDGQHASLQGSGGTLILWQHVAGVDPAKTYLLTGEWTLGDFSPACTFTAELRDGDMPTSPLIAETSVVLSSGKFNWLPFSVAGQPSGTDLTVLLRAADSGGNNFALHANDLVLDEATCTPPTIDAFAPGVLFRDTVFDDSISITGSGFVPGQTEVRIEGDDIPAIVATDVQVAPDGLSLTCDLDVPADAAIGTRTVVVEVTGCGGAALGNATIVLFSGPFQDGSFEQPSAPGGCPAQPQAAPFWWNAIEINGFGGSTKLFRNDLEPPLGPSPFLPTCPPPDGNHYAGASTEGDGGSSEQDFIFQTFSVTPGTRYLFSGQFAGGGNNLVQMEMRDGFFNDPVLASTTINSLAVPDAYDWTYNAVAGTPTGDFLTVGWRINVFGEAPHATYGDHMQVQTCSSPPTITGTITPATGTVGNVVQITDIPGSGFTGTPIVLFRTGETTIVADNVQVLGGGTSLSCEVDLTGVPDDIYDVIVIQNGCYDDLSLAGAFEVVCDVPLSTLTSIDATAGSTADSAASLTITGTDLDALTGIELVRDRGGAMITGVLGPADSGATERAATFDLTAAEMGRYDLVPIHPCQGVLPLDRAFLVYLDVPANLSFETGADPGDPTDAWCDGVLPNGDRTPDKSRPVNWDESEAQMILRRDNGTHVAPCPLPDGDHYAGLSFDGAGPTFSLFQSFATSPGQQVTVTASFTGGIEGGCLPHSGRIRLLAGDELTGTEAGSTAITNPIGQNPLDTWVADEVSGVATGSFMTLVIEMDTIAAGDCAHALHVDDVQFLFGAPCNFPFADSDGDGDVDHQDFAVLQLCLTGPSGPVPMEPDYCRCLNRNPETDNAITQLDVAEFINCATGPDIPFDDQNPPPGCNP